MNRVLPDSINPKNRLRNIKRFLAASSQPQPERYGRWVSFFREEDKQRLYQGEMKSLLRAKRPTEWMEQLFSEYATLDPVDAAMAVDVRSYLPFDLLVKVDITSMANSLEARSPFLDHEVMEFAASLPVHLKLNGRDAKYLLKKAFADLLPPENVNRRKMGFGVPIGHWFRTSLRELLCDSLLSDGSRVYEFLEAAEIRRIVTEHLNQQADHSFNLWSLLMLELWIREFVAEPVQATRLATAFAS